MKVKVQIVAAINNTSPRDREVRTDEFITDSDEMKIPDNHINLIKGILDSGYSIETITLMNETQSRVIQSQAVPQSLLFKGFELSDLELLLSETNPVLLQ